MNSSLFRSEVYENRRSVLAGSISLREPRSGWAFMGFGMCAVLAIALLLALGQYDRHGPVSGALVPSDGLLTVVAPERGPITRVFVREGEWLRAGQPLLGIAETQTSASSGDAGVAVFEQMAFKRQRLLDDLTGQDRLAGMQSRDIQRAALLIPPVDDPVTDSPVDTEQFVVAELPMATVLPAATTLPAELWVPTQGSGFMRKGGEVVIRYRAYGYHQFGQYFGRDHQVSRDLSSLSEANKVPGKEIKKSGYRVLVHRENQHVQVYGRPEAQRPGMTLDAGIRPDRRRLFEWIFDPLYGFGQRSIKDCEHG
ncbi:hypothetical protein CEK69_03100 [Xanthomonas sp. LMG 12462]|uniref:hypothetical protein n=1 Tax=Xanthomonas sp. LMG 12462 TaxID=1591134 RepID=UPI001264D7A4|nr:hypothetical protein [Xanthomonas sp. LMG 12462]KAB7773709.1 hypothetical protein CEK69_03100 [Xanthomonas sp. LMG 12462]